MGGMAKAIEDGHAETAHRGSRCAHAGAHRQRQQTVVGVNKFKPDEAEIDILKVDNTSVRNQQLEKLPACARTQTNQQVDEKLDVLTRIGAGRRRQPARARR
jgi:methylmalonyl-CoA mutase